MFLEHISETTSQTEIEDGTLVKRDDWGEYLVNFGGKILTSKADNNLLVNANFHHYK